MGRATSVELVLSKYMLCKVSSRIVTTNIFCQSMKSIAFHPFRIHIAVLRIRMSYSADFHTQFVTLLIALLQKRFVAMLPFFCRARSILKYPQPPPPLNFYNQPSPPPFGYFPNQPQVQHHPRSNSKLQKAVRGPETQRGWIPISKAEERGGSNSSNHPGSSKHRFRIRLQR
jgi:hypothetical protein